MAETDQEGKAAETVVEIAKKSASSTVFILIGVAFFLTIGTICLLVFTSLGDHILHRSIAEKKSGELSAEELAEMEKKAKEITFLSVPELFVNLKSTKGKGSILKASFVLQVSNEREKEQINNFIPLIIDQFQTFLREMDVTDVQGSAGIERIRQELFTRINQIIAPFKVKEILVREFLVQ